MREDIKYTLMVAGMVVAWSVYYAVSKIVVGLTGSALLAGFLLRAAAFVFLTLQLLLDKSFSRLFHQGKAVLILVIIGVFGFLLDLFANLGYAGGSLSTGTALLKTDVLMVNLATVILYHKKLYLSDWIGTLIMLVGVLLVLGVDFGGMEFHPSDLFFILSAVCVSANAFIIKTAQEKYHEDADMISYSTTLWFCFSSVRRQGSPVQSGVLICMPHHRLSGGLSHWVDLLRPESIFSITAT